MSALLLLARSPGGVEGVDAWFKAVPITDNLQGRYQWLDFSGDSVVQYAQNRVSGSYVFMFISEKKRRKFVLFVKKSRGILW